MSALVPTPETLPSGSKSTDEPQTDQKAITPSTSAATAMIDTAIDSSACATDLTKTEMAFAEHAGVQALQAKLETLLSAVGQEKLASFLYLELSSDQVAAIYSDAAKKSGIDLKGVDQEKISDRLTGKLRWAIHSKRMGAISVSYRFGPDPAASGLILVSEPSPTASAPVSKPTPDQALMEKVAGVSLTYFPGAEAFRISLLSLDGAVLSDLDTLAKAALPTCTGSKLHTRPYLLMPATLDLPQAHDPKKVEAQLVSI